MRNLSYIIILFLAIFGLAACGGSANKQGGDGYRIVYVSKDGSKEVEKIEAQNDTDAVRQYTKRVAELAFSNLGQKEFPYKEIQILSPSGENLNKNEEVMRAAVGDLERIADEAESMSEKFNGALKLSEELDKAIAEGNKKKADSIRAEMDKVEL